MNNNVQTAPVEEGDELEVTIEGIGDKGDGIAKVDGFVLFVPGTRQGDKVKVKVTKVLKNMGFAEVVVETDEATADAEETEESEDTEESSSEDDEQEEFEDTETFGEETEEDDEDEEE